MAEDSDNGDDSQKTEDPTQHKIEQAFKEGQTFYSKDLTNFFILLILTITIMFFSNILPVEGNFLVQYIGNSYQIEVSEANLGKILKYIIFKICIITLIPSSIVFLVTIFSPFIQTGRFTSSLDAIFPKLEKISLMKGIKKLFSFNSLIEFIKNIIKLVFIGLIAFYASKSEFNKISVSYFLEINNLASYIIKLTIKLLKYILIMTFFIAIFDYLYQRIGFFSRLKMSKYDLKQEYKQTEGNPEIKSKLRQIRAGRAKKRMMSAVPKADVVIMNPTHYAVALKYEQTKMNAPIIVAKGKDIIALKIKEIALKNNIVIIENPPLARSLYDNGEIDQEIPIEHYKAVAEIISYVYKIRAK